MSEEGVLKPPTTVSSDLKGYADTADPTCDKGTGYLFCGHIFERNGLNQRVNLSTLWLEEGRMIT